MDDASFAQKAKLFRERALAQGVPEPAIARFISEKMRQNQDERKNNQVIDVGGRRKLVNLTTGSIIADLGPIVAASGSGSIDDAEAAFDSRGSVGSVESSDSSNFKPKSQGDVALDAIRKIDSKGNDVLDIESGKMVGGVDLSQVPKLPSGVSFEELRKSMFPMVQGEQQPFVAYDKTGSASKIYRDKVTP